MTIRRKSSPLWAAASVRQRTGKCGGELDKIGLAAGACLEEYAVQMGLDGGFGDTQRQRRLRNAANLDDSQQHTQFGRRQFERSRNEFATGAVQRHLSDEQGGDGPV